MGILIQLAMIIFFNLHAHAADVRGTDEERVISVEVVELEDRGLGQMGNLDFFYFGNHPKAESHASVQNDSKSSKGDVSLDQIINLGKQIWNVIVKNRPVVNVTTDMANALPKGVNSALDLEHWQEPQSKVFKISFKNKNNAEVVRFAFRTLYTAGGSYQNQGHYLTHIQVIPADLYVAWGFTLNAEARVPSITNAGTLTDPLAQAEILVKVQVETTLQHIEKSASFFVKGDGKFVWMN